LIKFLGLIYNQGMATNDRHPHDWKEARRLRAIELKQQGWTQRQIAEAFGVTEGAVSRWIAAERSRGPAALRARPRSGAPTKLSQAQRTLIPELLSRGAEAYGFRGQVWTCGRIIEVLRREFGASSHKGHVSRLLREWEWMPQVPIRRATQWDEDEIARGRAEVWPDLQSGCCVSSGS
jgi:transposase